MSKVFRIDIPAQGSTCVVADSPHSGRDYPADFDYACGLQELRQAEDMAVDTLYNFLPALGVPLLAAEFPRAYIDVNRTDTVTRKFKAEGEQDYEGTESSLARAAISPRAEKPIYNRKLKLSEVFNRVASYHKPYHDRLEKMIDDTHAANGKVVHLNLHSMPSVVQRGTKINRYDVILGTRDDASADPAITEKLRSLFAAKGYKVGVNNSGFKGAEILRRAGDPQRSRHSIQVELNRKLYMDEKALVLNASMPKLQQDLQDIMAEFTVWCDANVKAAPTPKRHPAEGRGPARA